MGRKLLPLLVGLAFACLGKAKEKPTNFVVFLTDDLGWGDLACYGHPVIQTPNLDKFAQQGMLFTQSYSACGVCSPSRSSILTGRTPYRNGVWRWIPGGHQVHLRTSEITSAELLKEKGYQTCHVGKWHLNGKFNSKDQPQPDAQGFDHWMATQNNAAPNHRNPRNFVRNGKEVGELEGYSAPLVVEEGIRWLKEKRDPKKPFFLNVWTHEPHLPIESDPKFMELYKEFDDEGIRQHHGNVSQIDHAFGSLMKALDELGETKNTFVIFTSDNGPEGNGVKGRTRGSTGGLRERKRSSHEGGIRVPGIIRWPGQVPAGTTNRIPIIGSDVFSTMLAIAGIPLPQDRTIDGVDIRPVFAEKPVKRPVPLYWRNHLARSSIHVALREDEWKILGSAALDKFQLYHIEKDWQEKNDLASSNPKKLAELKEKLLAVHAQVEKEGPSEWWTNEAPRGKPRKPKKSGLLLEGKDETGGAYALVKGGTASKHKDSALSHALTSSGEAIALRELPEPATRKLVLKTSYKSLASGSTQNAAIAFGDSTKNDDLLKVGTAIGMNAHVLIPGSWENVRGGAKSSMLAKKDSTFELTLSVDLAKRSVTATINNRTLTFPLPDDIKQIRYFGPYVKGTSSAFAPIEVVESK
ncbi:MAG: N-acetylgalactosamine-6-sulfatase [Opitutae bacterium]|nr:N-acetylgalactosamine-6-sulfatase [Opitutae bacterium]|tara:strand:+ start:5670 stop:7580 length:1911 start_codon:yes stop_codon:yes gene_type:complete